MHAPSLLRRGAVGVVAVLVASLAAIAPASAVVEDTTPPSVPVVTTPWGGPWLTRTEGVITVGWAASSDAESGVTHYDVAVDDDLLVTRQADETSPTGHLHADLAVSHGPHTVTITAVDAAGNRATAVVSVLAGDPPAAPVVTTAVAGDGTVTLTWDPVESADPVEEYRVLVGGSWSASVWPGQATSATVGGLLNGSEYEVDVVAMNTFGETWTSLSLTPNRVFLTAPEPGTTTGTPVTVTWEPAHDIRSEVQYYVVNLDSVPVRFVGPDVTSVEMPLAAGRAEISVTAVTQDGVESTTSTWTVVEVAWVDKPTFVDVPSTHPFFSEILWMVQAGITTGYADGTFRALAPINRDAMAAFLYRYAAAELSGYTPPATPLFRDVPRSHPFYTEISWMGEMGISTGYSDGTFRPSTPVKRDAMAAFLFRFAGAEEYYAAPDDEMFYDVWWDDPFFTEISWLAETGISTGWPDATYRPDLAIERAAMAAFLYRMDQAASATIGAARPAPTPR